MERESMSFWQQHQKAVMQQWELRRRPIEREVAERRRDLVRRNLRQSSEWSTYEPYAGWYLEREVEAFVGAVDEVSTAGQLDIDDDSVDAMEQTLAEMIDRRQQLAPAEAVRELAELYSRLKEAARVGLQEVQSSRREERKRGAAPPPPPPIRRASHRAPEAPAAVAPTAAAAPETAEEEAPIDVHCLAENLRGLGYLIQRLPDTEEQAETLEELQFVAEEATADPERRKLRMVGSALERIRARIAAADPESAGRAARLADPVRRWFGVR
jgi:hypothetical protein